MALDPRFRGGERKSSCKWRITSAKTSSYAHRVAFFVYILASRPNGTLYVGMTDDLLKRTWQHRNEITPGFTLRYGVKALVWYESHESRESAFRRERQLKKWDRAWKLALIERDNPQWRDLWTEIAAP